MVDNNRGIALVLTLWIMLALIILAAGIAVMSRTETQIARNYADVVHCRWAARAGVFSALENIKTLNQEQTTYLGEEPYLVLSGDLNIDLGGYTFETTIVDESGKINLNTAGADLLTSLFGTSDISDCIVDWRDADDTPGAGGAETEYYSSLDPPYKCRNAAFQTLGELNLVKGITDDILSAPPTNGTHPMIDLLTVYAPTAQASTTGTTGATKVDIQSASQADLQSALGDVLSAGEIAAIVDYRRRQPFRSPAEIVMVPGLSRLKIEQVYDKLTVSGADTPSGLLNINTATVEALTVQPGLDQTTAQAIVDYRANQGAFASVGGLLAVSDVTNEAFVSSAKFFAVKSTVFKIISKGLRAGNGASATITCVVETGSDGTAQTRYWQE